jgi:hypothetical protein
MPVYDHNGKLRGNTYGKGYDLETAMAKAKADAEDEAAHYSGDWDVVVAKKPGSQHATKKYGKKASEKVGRALHEMKRGKLRSGSGGKVTSREQAIAIGLSQARSRGYKVPPSPSPSGHATKSVDERVRTYLSNMRPGQEIDARGIARALGGGIAPLEADYALKRAVKAGLAVSSDGRWFGPAGKSAMHHSKMLSSPVVRVERVKMPNDATAEIHIHHGKGGYSGVLVFGNGNELPMSLGVPVPKTAAEAVRGAKKFLAQVYGRSN